MAQPSFQGICIIKSIVAHEILSLGKHLFKKYVGHIML